MTPTYHQMKIKIKQPVALHETGKRALNEDFIFPLHNQANPEERLFVVCDGEGGANVGEVAAKLVALSFAKYFASRPPQEVVDQAYLDAALHTAEEALSAYKDAHPDSKGMATTLALLHLGDEQVSLAWVGNSHLYYFDQKAQQLQSPSLEKGNPQALITGSNKPQSIQVRTIPLEAIHAGDYFFLATDGISDQVDRSSLEGLLKGGGESTLPKLIEEVRNLSQGFTEDNYSGYLLQVAGVQAVNASGAVLAGDDAQAHRGGGTVNTDQGPEPESSPGAVWRNLAIGGIVLLLLAAVIVMWPSGGNEYRDLMAEGDASMEEGDYGRAATLYDNALNHYADNEQEMDNAAAKRRGAMERSQQASSSRGMSLPDAAEAYIDRGKEFFENKAYVEALLEWEKAEQKINETGGVDTLLPRVMMTQAYLYAGNTELDKQNFQQAETYYQQAVALLDHPALAKFDPTLAQMARERLQTATANAASQPKPLADKQGSASRRMAPAQSPEKTSSPDPAANTQATGGANARVAPARSAMDAPQMSEAERAERNKQLSTGKRLYTQAKEQESAYLYQSSAKALEAAGPLLDGSGAYLLAYMYHSGLGVTADKAKALRYAQLSARRNWPSGQYYYGFLLLQRQNPRDTVSALQSLESAANNNYLKAIKLLQELR
jgi:protein phosphatase